MGRAAPFPVSEGNERSRSGSRAAFPRSGLGRLIGPVVRSLVVLLALGCFMAVLAGCGSAVSGGSSASNTHLKEETIRVFAAASLSEAFQDLGRAYTTQNSGVGVEFVFDGSQRLRLQLEHGAQADVFASADWEQARAALDAGVLTGAPVSFASNQLAILLHKGSSLERSTDGSGAAGPSSAEGKRRLFALAEPDVRIVAAISEAPVGRYTEELLGNMAENPELGRPFYEAVVQNIVSRETNVRGVVQKVALGEADAGIAYRTDGLDHRVSSTISVLEIPEALNVTADYPIAAASENASAADFIGFVLSEEGQSILGNHGFGPPLSK